MLRIDGNCRRTELYDNLAKVVRMATILEETHITHGALILIIHLESILLHVTDTLHAQAYHEQDDARDIPTLSELRLREPRDDRRVQYSDRQARRPAPHHLEHEKAQKREEFVALVVEAVILAGLQDPEQQEPAEPCSPRGQEQRDDDLTSVGSGVRRVAWIRGATGGEGEGEDGDEDEVGAACEVGELVEFEGKGEGEGDELVDYCYEEGYSEVVVIEDVDGHLCGVLELGESIDSLAVHHGHYLDVERYGAHPMSTP